MPSLVQVPQEALNHIAAGLGILQETGSMWNEESDGADHVRHDCSQTDMLLGNARQMADCWLPNASCLQLCCWQDAGQMNRQVVTIVDQHAGACAWKTI